MVSETGLGPDGMNFLIIPASGALNNIKNTSEFDSMFCKNMQGDLFITIGLSETWQLLLVIVIQMKQVGSTVQQLMCTRAIHSQEWINTLNSYPLSTLDRVHTHFQKHISRTFPELRLIFQYILKFSLK